MKVLIVEDETAAFENLKKILTEIDYSIEVIGNTEGIRQTIYWLQNNEAPDLIFMDIHLSDGSAFNIFNSMDIEIPIVFTTAYDEYAIDAFRVNSIDYILKPVEKAQGQRALNKFRKWSKHDIIQQITQLSRLTPSGKYFQKILIPVSDKLIPVNIDDISCFYTTNNNTRIMMKNGNVYPYNKTLDGIFQSLNPRDFFRANKQFIVSKNSIINLTIWFDSRLLVTLDIETDERIYVSKNKTAEFKKWMIEDI